MNILIAGASGFIGHELVAALKAKHQISVLGRNKTTLMQEFPGNNCYTWDDLDALDAKLFDVVINLCGFNISAARWTPAIKKKLLTHVSTLLKH